MQNSPKSLSRWWLLIGCWSVALAGLFSIVLVVARAPQLKEMPLFTRLFHEALVVHVDLSVLVWFMAIACLLWSIMVAKSRSFIPYLEEAALISTALGTAAITLSPLDPKGEAMMSNYIPVIYSPVFFLGLALLFCGAGLMLLRLFTAKASESIFNKEQRFGLQVAGVVTFISLCAFIWSYAMMPKVIDGTQYYEILFWGGGHILQFTHTQILMICWWLMIVALVPTFTLHKRIAYVLLSVALAAALVSPLGYVGGDVSSMQHRQFFTNLMIGLNGHASAIFMLLLLVPLWRARSERKGANRALWSCLVTSIFLYAYGGVLGLMIQGQNVVIPAHYHGSIVGITLAFMGVAYLMFPKLGYRNVAGWRLAYWQPIVYAVGQVMHISGLAWSGGYGVLRKTPGGIEHMELPVKIAMGFMGGGGLIAIFGGLMFVIVAAKAVFGKQH
ncbi:MAG: cbb3-type cytochrome c oxidase subunit I [Alphaproteobacteria bacterium]